MDRIASFETRIILNFEVFERTVLLIDNLGPSVGVRGFLRSGEIVGKNLDLKNGIFFNFSKNLKK